MTGDEAGTERRLSLRSGAAGELGVDVLAVVLREGAPLSGVAARADEWLGGALGRALGQGAVRAGPGECSFLPAGAADRPHVLAVGTGKERVGPNALRRAAAVAVRAARRHRMGSVAFSVPEDRKGETPEAVQAAAEGLVLGDWTLEGFRSRAESDDRPPRPGRGVVHVPDPADERAAGEAVKRGRIVAAAQNYARGLVARPGNVATPGYLAEEAERLARTRGLRVEIRGPDRLREEGFGALLSVARGSTQEPRFIRLEHEGAAGPPHVLIGKGVTFDSGGISLKPSDGMEEMKTDMAGGAAVLGAMRALAELEVPVRAIGLVPATENLPSGSALKPADVIRGVSGTTIEVVNTDAEGRLILSDALSHAADLEPRAVVDVATLTGGCVTALGRHASGLMSDHDGLAAGLEEAGERTGERVWRLPLWSEYREQLDSEIADLKNSGGREASVLTAGCFLREFAGDSPWAHLDIAGTARARTERGWNPEGATGVGVRLLVAWLSSAA